MPDVSAHWATLLDPALTRAFYIGFSDGGRRASMIPELYDVRRSSRASETYQGVGVLSTNAWNFEDSGRVQYEDIAKGYPKTFTHVEFAKGIMVQRKLVDDNQTQIVFDSARGLGDSAYRKREKGAASVFNNAFTDTGTNDDGQAIAGPDGVGLVSTAHPLNAETSTTQSNEGTAALSAANLGAARRAMHEFTDDSGDIMDNMADLLLVPPELEDTALELTQSQLAPESGNNAINPQRGRFQVKVWHYLTDPNAWFLIDSSRMRQALIWYDRIPLEFAREEDFETLFAKWRAYMRYSYGWVDWSWIWGSNPS